MSTARDKGGETTGDERGEPGEVGKGKEHQGEVERAMEVGQNTLGVARGTGGRRGQNDRWKRKWYQG